MKVVIRSIEVATEFRENKYHDIEDRRDVKVKVLDQYGQAATFRLPSVEVDGLIVVGGVYELMFARRES